MTTSGSRRGPGGRRVVGWSTCEVRTTSVSVRSRCDRQAQLVADTPQVRVQDLSSAARSGSPRLRWRRVGGAQRGRRAPPDRARRRDTRVPSPAEQVRDLRRHPRGRPTRRTRSRDHNRRRASICAVPGGPTDVCPGRSEKVNPSGPVDGARRSRGRARAGHRPGLCGAQPGAGKAGKDASRGGRAFSPRLAAQPSSQRPTHRASPRCGPALRWGGPVRGPRRP